MSIRQLGVLLSEDELRFISHLLINLKADDLIMEDARCDALAWITRVSKISPLPDRTGRGLRSRKARRVVSRKWPAGTPAGPFIGGKNGSSTPSWLAPSSPSEVRLGSDSGLRLSPDAYGVDLWPTSEVSLAQRIWAQLSLGFVGTSGRMQ